MIFENLVYQALLMTQQPHPDPDAGGTVQSARNRHFCSRDADARDRVACQHPQAFAAEVIDHAQDSEPPAIDQGTRHKAERPALVRTLCDGGSARFRLLL